MKLNKLFLGLLGLTAMVMSSCSDNDDYQWATASGEQVYFSNELPASYEISFDASSFTIPVSRVNTSSSITVPVSIESDGNFFSAPASVQFAAGESTANLTISYDPDSLVYDAYKNAKLTIGKEYTTPYGKDTYSFKAGIASPYKSIGKGTFTDNFWFEASASVTIMQNTENPSEFRIMDPFNALAKAAETSLDGNQDPYIQLTILKKGETYRNVEITRDGLVGYGLLNTGYFHTTYEADVLMVYPGMFSSLQNEDVYAYNYVVEWQENGLPGRIQLAPYYYMDGVGGWNNTTSDDIVIIDFPGYNPKDLSIEVDYLGVLTDSQGQANAAITLTLGSDVTEAKAVVVSADADPDAVADAIAAGEMEATPIAAGYNFVPIEEGLSGKLMVVSVVLDEGAVKGLALNNFEYYGGAANPWEVAGIGNYVYTAFFGTEEEPFVDEGLELQYNAEEDVYRITHWGYDIDFTFMLDKETNKVLVPAQFTGYTHSSYGDVYVGETNLVGKAEWEAPDSSYDPETLTFNFSLAYYVDAGYFGYGVETFTLTPTQARRLGLDKKHMPKVNNWLKVSPRKTHARNSVVMSHDRLAD